MSRKSVRSKLGGAAAVAVLSALWIGGPLLAQKPGAEATPAETIVVGDFAGAPAGKLPADWLPLEFPKIKAHTVYTAVTDASRGQVVRASAVASASGLAKKLAFDLHAYPVLRWQWKADNLIAGSNMTR